MAITRRFQARATVTSETHSAILLSAAALRKKGIEVVGQAKNADGTVQITFAGHGLGKKAVPVPPPCAVSIVDGLPVIQIVE